ncbi:ABC transporter substrate-binding protein [Leifsonia shinshuensis]|uniref:Peptide/nickel transport system substrate-binding protein n=1 Tax=Leifsonia shinshuensis TaxID=150026 RepID=A0A853CNQ5_9MICO|nr:ABC transporter substrate-binding protein [Leifsonia shinshuensis]NYJ22287.1 peptide/nickel transport system substrate-binding protein [Leifsonia shinshuensis]
MTSPRIRRVTAGIATAAAAALVLSACAAHAAGSTSAASAKPVEGGDLTFALANDPITLNPTALGSGNDTLYVERQLFESLTEQDPKTGKVIPGLATKWQANADATQFTFTLRPGVTFSDGTPLTASVVKANFDDIVANATKAVNAVTALPNYAGTTVVNDSTATVSFSKPNGAFPQAASSVALALLSPKSLAIPFDDRATGTGLSGTGPFTLESYTKNTSVVLKKRSGYSWAPEDYSNRAAAHLDTVTFKIVPEAGVRTGGLTSKQFDAVGGVLPQDIATLKAGETGLVIRPNPGVAFGLTTYTKPGTILSDQKVRTALLTAIDRTAIQQSALTSDFKVASSVLAANTPGWVDLSKQLTSDPKASAKLLDDDGWKKGADGIRVKDGKRLTLRLGYIANFNPNQSIVELIQQQLKQLGIEVTVWTGTVPQYFAQSNAGAFDLAYGNLSRADGDVLRTQFLNALPSNTVKGYTDPQLNQLLLDQLATPDQDKRNAIAQQAGQRIVDLAYYIPVVELTTILGTGQNVHGIVLGADSRLGSLVDAYKTK